MGHDRTLNRRRFLAASTAAAAAPAFIPASAFGANEKITLGVVGCGGRGNANLSQFLKDDRCRVVAVCDVDREHGRQQIEGTGLGLEPVRQRVNKHYGQKKSNGVRAHTDFRKITEDESIDAVLVATPDHWHALIAHSAVTNGKDVYCEKPITHTLEEGKALYRAAQEHEAVFQVGSQQRSTWNFRWAVELVRNGHIGRIKHVEVGLPTGNRPPEPAKNAQPPDDLDYNLWCGPSEKLPYDPKRLHWHWRWNLAYGGGQLMDWIGHHNDIAHWGCGFDETGPVEVVGSGQLPPRDALWNAAVHYNVFSVYEDGTTIHICDRNRKGVKFIGEDGWVFVRRGKLEASDPKMVKKGFDRGEEKVYKSNHHQRNFLDCVQSRETPIAPPETGHRSITPGHLGYASMFLNNRRIKWDPAKEQVIGDSEADQHLRFSPRDPWTKPW